MTATLTDELTPLKEEYLKIYPNSYGSILILRIKDLSQEDSCKTIEYQVN